MDTVYSSYGTVESSEPATQLWIATTKAEAVTNPELASAILQATTLGADGLTGDGYFSPGFRAMIDSPETTLVRGAIGLGADAIPNPVPGLVVGGVNLFIDYANEKDQEKRKEFAEKIRIEQPELLLQAIERLPATYLAYQEIIEANTLPANVMAGIKSEKAKLDELWKQIPGPNSPAAILDAYTKNTQGTSSVLTKELGEKLNAVMTTGKSNAEKVREIEKILRNTSKDVAGLAVAVGQLQGQLDVLLTKEAPDDSAQWAQTLKDVRAVGSIVGLIVGINNPKEGKAIETIVSSAVAIAESVSILKKGFELAAFSSGLGASFAIAGALGVFGKQGGANVNAEILKAIEGVVKRLEQISRQVSAVDKKIDRLIDIAQTNFGLINFKLDKLESDVQLLSSYQTEVLYLQLQAPLENARTALALAASVEDKQNVIKKMVLEAYVLGIKNANQEIFTRTKTRKLSDYPKVISEIHKAWVLTARDAQKFREYTHVAQESGLSLVNLEAGFNRLLELNPSLVNDSVRYLIEDLLLHSDSSYPEEKRTGLLSALSWPPNGLHAESKRLLMKESLNGNQSNVCHPIIVDEALSSIKIALHSEMMFGHGGGALKPSITCPEIFRDLVLQLKWYQRAVAILGSDLAQVHAERHYLRACEHFLAVVSRGRIDSFKLSKKNLPALSWPSDLRLSLALSLGITKLSTAESQLFSPYLSRPRGWVVPDRSAESLNSSIREEDDCERLFDAARLSCLCQLTGGLESIDAWVDSPFMKEAWRGRGDYHEIYSLRVKSITDAVGADGEIMLWIRIDDRRRGIPDHYLKFNKPQYYGVDGPDPDAGSYTVYPANLYRRGHFTFGYSNNIKLEMSPGPYDDWAYRELVNRFGEVGRSVGGYSLDISLAETFAELKQMFEAKGIGLSFYMGTLAQPGDKVTRGLLNFLSTHCSLKNVFGDSPSQQGGRGRWLDCLDELCGAWAYKFTTKLAAAEWGKGIGDAVKMLPAPDLLIDGCDKAKSLTEIDGLLIGDSMRRLLNRYSVEFEPAIYYFEPGKTKNPIDPTVSRSLTLRIFTGDERIDNKDESYELFASVSGEANDRKLSMPKVREASGVWSSVFDRPALIPAVTVLPKIMSSLRSAEQLLVDGILVSGIIPEIDSEITSISEETPT
ncbi:hypothetical protein [Variovorax sp. PCZ-1]|uniref:hypothetical protein n=1 Tax=Variovorax sp. PCZ-1 TaxID=2835533 RepID=UPI001BCB5461|nr:hypothetical protein [Variovorax sp. PCZ-1]MBS7807314.1 hypothetical protein [Variovorax sp. PCZ-1]